ncbi:MAG: UDP-N-acetylmuramate: L-alanyl-gamma-D-glutamyl-meso-diaminopimelate ligase [Granulosicoccus sp.]
MILYSHYIADNCKSTQKEGMRIHFIAIGGSAMHNLALALHHKGDEVSGSDDEIFEPSKGRLKSAGLLPKEQGWFEDKITTNLDAVILGMHARADNPELLKAQKVGLRIYSYPEYLYEQTKSKKRVVIGGSHGKTSITAMILHVLNHHEVEADYMVGAQLEGFDTMVRLTDEAEVVVLEGDEYLSSPIDRRPKFHLYRPDVALISGISWDHINVFPTFENYIEQFSIFIDLIEEGGQLIYCTEDKEVRALAEDQSVKASKIPYGIPPHKNRDGITYLQTSEGEVPLKIFGNHNLMNLEGARAVCTGIGLDDLSFYQAICTFKGASMRLELVAEGENSSVFKDFAHSPSKLEATTGAVKDQFTDRRLVACMELHTFSSLNRDFLDQYNGSMDKADTAIVYFNPETLKHKRLPDITAAEVKEAFAREDLLVITDSTELSNHLQKLTWRNTNLLLMSSGNFDGLSLEELGKRVVNS